MARKHNATADGAEVDDDALIPQVRDALRHLHDPTQLQVHPLARAFGPRQRGDSSPGKELSRRLVEAIETLRPAREVSAESHAWRSYNLLHLRYVEALETSEVQQKLSISKSEYHRDHQQAVTALASLLLRPDAPPSPLRKTSPSGDSPAPQQTNAKLETASATLTNLPLQLTSFVGRKAEIADVRRLLGEHRLVTLTGAGGCGKTRLAYEAAADLFATYHDGVWTVELAALANPALVPQTAALALGVRETPGVPIESTLVEHLRGRELLLILDNCEHLLDACARLSDRLLRSCPTLRILATSREALGVFGETSWRVPSLSTPMPDGSGAWERVEDHDSVRLLAERARLVRPGFALTEGNASTIAEVCSRLDGMPLAIELAAAQLAALSVDQLASRLDDRFRILTKGSRTALPRQQTLRGTLDWSHGLLTNDEQALFRRLAVFSGGWRLEAAEAVCSLEGIETAAVLELLTGLVRKSLVVADEVASRARYRFLETIRQYAWEKLAEAGEAAATRDRHKAWCLSYLESPTPPSAARPRSYRAARLADELGDEVAIEHDNLRAALAWCLETDPSSGLRMARLLWIFWVGRGHANEGRRWVEELLAHAAERTVDRALALVGAAQLAEDQGDLDRAEAAAAESVSILRDHGDEWDIYWALHRLAGASQEKGDFERAKTLLEECLALSRRNEDQEAEYWALFRLGWIGILAGHSDRALELLGQARLIAQRGCPGGPMHLADVSAWEGRAWRATGDYPVARRLIEEALSAYRTLGIMSSLAWCLVFFGHALVSAGEYERAEDCVREGLQLLRAQGHRPRMCHALYVYGLAASGRADHARACRVIAAAAAGNSTPQTLLAPSERAEVRAALGGARAALGDGEFDRAWAEGHVMTIDQAVESAVGE